MSERVDESGPGPTTARPLAAGEVAGLAALAGLFDRKREPAYDALTAAAAAVCEAPIALVSLVDEERHRPMSSLGLPEVAPIGGDLAFCAYAIDHRDLFEVVDTRQDQRFALHPLVTGEPHIRFYAGMPLVNDRGLVLGVLSVMDVKPRSLGDPQRLAMAKLAQVAVGLFENGEAEAELGARLRGALDDAASLDRLIEERIRERTATLSASEQRHALVVAAANDALYEWDLRSDRIEFADRWFSFLGLSKDDMGDTPSAWLSRVHPDDLVWLQATLDEQAGRAGRPFQIEYRIVGAAGEYRWMACRGIAEADAAGEPVRIVGSHTDITDRKRAETALRESEERYALAAQGANDGLFDWAIDREEVYYSDRWRSLLGWPCAKSRQRIEDFLDCVAREDVAGLEAAIQAHIGGGTEHLEYEMRVRHSDGAVQWMVVRGLAVRDGEGVATRLVGSIRDVTATKRMQIELTHHALHDGLTDLPNRALFLDRIGTLLGGRSAEPGGADFVVAILSLDRFKPISDSLGPSVADQVLAEIARRLGQTIRPGDTVARVREDEFGLLLQSLDEQDSAAGEAARLNRVLDDPIRVGPHELVVSASIGIVICDGHRGQDAEAILRDASLAAFRAKKLGRGQIAVFDPAFHQRAVRKLAVENALRTAVDRHELCMFYQPLIDLESGALAGFEALMRWRRPDHGLVSPADFIPAAEDTGLIVPMGRRALFDAAGQLLAWSAGRGDADELMMSVNVSARQFRDDDLVGVVREVLAEHRIGPASLKLEVTESVLMDDPGKLAETLTGLRDLGVRISLDDFGTGYSSLSYLHEYPFDVLKIDRSFIRGAVGRKVEIARAIGLLGGALGLDIVAEGIEDSRDEAFARSLGSHYGQGYLYGRPQAPEDLASRVAESVGR